MIRATNVRNQPSSIALAIALTLVTAVLGLLVAPSFAGASAPTGKPVAQLSVGKAGKGLRGPGVKVRAVKPVQIRRSLAGFPISDVDVSGAKAGTFVLRGSLSFSRGKRKVRLSGMLVKLSGRKVSVTGRIGRKRVKIFTGKTSKAPTVDGARVAVSFTSSKMAATPTAMKLVARALRSRVAKSRFAGRLSGDAFVIAPPQSGVSTVSPAAASSCQPPTEAVFDPARPATAVDLGCAFLIFNSRDSWTNYMDTGAPITPAAALPTVSTSAHVCPNAGGLGSNVFSFRMQFKSGWSDSASGQAALFTGGGTHFIKAGNGIDIALTDFELRINGAATVLYATVVNAPHPGGKRVPFLAMNSAAPIAGGPAAPGTPLSRIRGTLTAEAITDIFEGIQYSAGDAFGCADFGFNF